MSDYTAGAQTAKTLAEAIADFGEIKVGAVTKTTSSTTAVVTHGLSSTPDFVLAAISANGGNILTPAVSSNTTSITFTLNTAQATWTVSYIAGYTA